MYAKGRWERYISRMKDKWAKKVTEWTPREVMRRRKWPNMRWKDEIEEL